VLAGKSLRRNARYQFSMAVNAPGADQAARYGSSSSGVTVPGRARLRLMP
jgi:hypothetical protein